MIKKNINKVDFINEFESMKRGDYFSHRGLVALYDYLCELSEESGDDIELDVIGLCCEFTEFENFDDFKASYDGDVESMDELAEYTTVITFDGGVIIQDF